MGSIGRRKFLISSGTAAATASLVSLGRSRTAAARGPWGELVEDPDGVLDLPEGFSYAILEQQYDPMDDGYRVPGYPDGMACFQGPDNTLILMRNHECNNNDWGNGPYSNNQEPPPEAYRSSAMGGVTRVVLDGSTYERISSNLVLVGTIRNCAGGWSPWGWLSCEETFESGGGRDHGYTFLCPIDAESVQEPQRIEGYGRFNHEAACIDPSNNYAYLSEDRGDSCLYRFVPDNMDEPFVGQLQALKIVGQNGYDTNNMGVDEVFEVEWVDIDNPDPNSDSVRGEAQGKGAATFVRGEGIWFFEGMVYLCSTSGGSTGNGQIFRLIDGDSPTLELIVSGTNSSVMEKPDNITVAPWGEVFMAEDGSGSQYIRWINEQGEVCDFARNALSGSEMAGVCFSPDGQAMFVNIQGDGLTLVITGPFPMMEEPGDGDGDPDPSGDGDGDPTTGDGDGDGDSTTGTGEGDGDGDPTTGAETDSGSGTDSTSGGDSDSDGGMGETGGMDPGLEEGGGGGGSGCSTTDSRSHGLGVAMTAAAALGLHQVLRAEDE